MLTCVSQCKFAAKKVDMLSKIWHFIPLLYQTICWKYRETWRRLTCLTYLKFYLFPYQTIRWKYEQRWHAKSISKFTPLHLQNNRNDRWCVKSLFNLSPASSIQDKPVENRHKFDIMNHFEHVLPPAQNNTLNIWTKLACSSFSPSSPLQNNTLTIWLYKQSCHVESILKINTFPYKTNCKEYD